MAHSSSLDKGHIVGPDLAKRIAKGVYVALGEKDTEIRAETDKKMTEAGYLKVEINDSKDRDMPDGTYYVKADRIQDILAMEEDKLSDGGIFFRSREFRLGGADRPSGIEP